MLHFNAEIKIIDGNPYVSVPESVLQALFKQHGTEKSPVPIEGTVNGKPYKQTLVKFRGLWRLYINTVMLINSPRRIGEIIEINIDYDRSDRSIEPHPKLIQALKKKPEAYNKFKEISPSLRKEIIRYIDNLKTEQSIERNVNRAVDFLLGKGSFIGRQNIK